ncbi:MAG: glutamate--tRNA ligase [Omnitrophica bacterium RIFCSPLOWO2_12_FULL_44_17]|uniref:Glutamate--tRNA ligase n=1 Tax=Candidatus Danuiimicrobium aquiferis TaxID=1801832 RepID=A0A1G1L043_9BACT|nr:MAG: glutamate--tRNA ligase [Omnitrophica bacterium RIFCSPHIGHO2_02_FULL_45_28]OGW89001.1 MAG: glutamate--tRNA ligase [Omnitrophica bacterium RIFCSPHIGHO2_12_FULL_44_12]OGW98512.1 MAG: glutamate--tRNA ligase [Omnitrophica bacterium RIFCSPLOWO2_12_FULL_44_17]OGX05064.1 MAG: glutamate--tRNA ligase [Omnitrophica bacterium RIFCSPLOWO2_02_FULL_44_11]
MTIRVRFAPSPTGYLHIGNIRTALFNYLFARHNQGTFILRIEDTDVERSRKEYADAILKDLKLLGMDWDEGPFYQSERLSIYQEHLEKLEKQGKTYLCYCSQDELKARRKEALALKQPAKYDGRCRTLSNEEKKRRIDQGIKPTVRFRVDETEPIIVHDLIRGEVRFDPQEIGDFVIMRPDPRGGDAFMPTFHMSVCIDDGLMGITHVIRGDDHLSNSPRHVLLFKAFGYQVPQFAHLSLIHGPGGEPLSKRFGAVTIPEFVDDRGYLPEAFCNYLALLGWSPKDNREIFSFKELIEAFDIANMTHHPAIFSEDKLIWVNMEHLKNLSPEDYLTRALEFLRSNHFYIKNEEMIKPVLLGIQQNIHRFDDLPKVLAFLNDVNFRARLQEQVMAGAGNEVFDILKEGRPVVLAAKSVLEKVGSQGEALLNELISEVQKITPEKGKKLYLPIRAAITAEAHGMELKKVFELLDKETLFSRFEYTTHLTTTK